MAPLGKGFLWEVIPLLILYTEGCLVSEDLGCLVIYGHPFLKDAPTANLTDEAVEVKLNRASYGLLFGEIATEV